MTSPLRATIELPTDAIRIEAAPPELVSQKTSLAVLGIPRRPFLDAVSRYRAGGGEVFHCGRLRLVNREAFVAWLRSSTSQGAKPSEGTETGQPSDGDLAASLGFRLVK